MGCDVLLAVNILPYTGGRHSAHSVYLSSPTKIYRNSCLTRPGCYHKILKAYKAEGRTGLSLKLMINMRLASSTFLLSALIFTSHNELSISFSLSLSLSFTLSLSLSFHRGQLSFKSTNSRLYGLSPSPHPDPLNGVKLEQKPSLIPVTLMPRAIFCHKTCKN